MAEDAAFLQSLHDQLGQTLREFSAVKAALTTPRAEVRLQAQQLLQARGRVPEQLCGRVASKMGSSVPGPCPNGQWWASAAQSHLSSRTIAKKHTTLTTPPQADPCQSTPWTQPLRTGGHRRSPSQNSWLLQSDWPMLLRMWCGLHASALLPALRLLTRPSTPSEQPEAALIRLARYTCAAASAYCRAMYSLLCPKVPRCKPQGIDAVCRLSSPPTLEPQLHRQPLRQ